MNERRGNALRGWMVLGVLLAVYHVVVFALPFPRTAVFWVCYLFTLAALLVQIWVIRAAFFRGEGVKSKFYGFPIARVGAVYLAVQLVLGLVFMALGAVVPVWLPVVACALALGGGLVGLAAADAAREEVERQDRVLERDVSAMRRLQSRGAALAARCPEGELGRALAGLADRLRYSDPVSGDATRQAEEELSRCLDGLEEAADRGLSERGLELCRRTEGLLEERNRLCRLHKGH